jgi:hypothetical protein
MELNIAQDLDKILNFLNKEKSQNHWFELLDKLKIDINNKELLYNELHTRNFICVMRVESGNHLIRISADGKAFLQSSSSFLRQSTKLTKDRTRTTIQQSILTIANIFSIISVISVIILGVLSYKQNETIKDLNSEIKTLKQENTRLQDSLSLRPNFRTTDNKTK